MTHFSRLCAGLMLLLSGVIAVAQQPAEAPAGVRLSIQAQPLSEALRQFAHQSGLQLVFRAEDVSPQLRAPALVGTYRPEAALKQLLENSGLNYKFVNPGTVAVRPSVSTTQQEGAAQSKDMRNATAPLRMAAVADKSAANGSDPASTEAEPPSGATSQKGIPEILVRDRRSANTGIRRSEDDVQPYVVFNAEDIEKSMASTLEDFLRTRLPMNQNAEPSSTQSDFSAGRSRINLRGLGTDETLVLVNGRRLPATPSPLGHDVYQSDINGIPLSAIERIEILPSTAGGIYGGGATGGVVNIILKRDYQGLRVRAGYDGTTHGGASKRRLEASGSFSLEGGRTSITALASYTDSQIMPAGYRDFDARARARQLANAPDVIMTDFAGRPIRGYTTNIASVSGNPLVLAATGQSLGSDRTHVPVGYAGPDSDDGTAFLQTAGAFNTDLPNDGDLGGLKQQLFNEPTARSLSLSVRREFSERIEAFIDLSHSTTQVNGNAYYSSDGQFQTLPVGPSNPFTEPVSITIPLVNISDELAGEKSVSRASSIVGGLVVRLPAGWSAQAEYNWGRSRARYESNVGKLTSDGLAALSDGRLDPLRDVNTYPLDLTAYYAPVIPQNVYQQVVVQKNTSLRLAGPVWRLPGGAMNLSMLLERREEGDEKPRVGTTYSRDGVPSYRYFPGREWSTDSLYAELTAPLVGAANARPGVQGLELQASLRQDRTDSSTPPYVIAGGASIPSPEGPYPQYELTRNSVEGDQYTFGARYQPFSQLALRVSYGEGVLPPPIYLLAPIEYAASTVAFFGSRLQDPKRGGENLLSLMRVTAAGSPKLQPEESESLSAGVIFTPTALPGLRVSVDYTKIDKINEFSTSLPRQLFLDLEDQGFADRLVRGPLTPADELLGYTGGPVLELDSGFANIAVSKVEAYDVQADYTWHTAYGEFTANLIGTWQPHLQQQVLPGEPVGELVGRVRGPLKLRGNMGLSWTRGAWSAGWNMQYYDSYSIYEYTDSVAQRAEKLTLQGSPTIPSQNYHDVFVRYRFDETFDETGADAWGFLDGVEILGSIRNIFDAEPPLLALESGRIRSFSTYGDPRLRSYSIMLSKSFQ